MAYLLVITLIVLVIEPEPVLGTVFAPYIISHKSSMPIEQQTIQLWNLLSLPIF